MVTVSRVLESQIIPCPECGAALTVDTAARAAVCSECDFKLRPRGRTGVSSRTVQGPVASIAVACLTGTFMGVLAVPVFVGARAALILVDAYFSPHSLTFEECWRFIALVELIEAVPLISGWAVAGALVGLVLGSVPDALRSGLASHIAGALTGAMAGYLCGITLYASAPAPEMLSIGAALGVATAARLKIRSR